MRIRRTEALYLEYLSDGAQMKRVKQKVARKLPEFAYIVDIVMDRYQIDWSLIQEEDADLGEEMFISEVELIETPSLSSAIATTLDTRLLLREHTPANVAKYLDKEKTVTFKKGTSKGARRRAKWLKWLETLPQCGLVTGIHSEYDVTWQDGTKSCKVPSLDLLGYDPSGVNEFWHGSVVCRAQESDELEVTSWGVVQLMKVEQQLVTVKWIMEEGRRLEEPVTECISAFLLVEHPNLNDVLLDTIVVKTIPDSQLLAVGEVIKLVDGVATVYWFDGTTSDAMLDDISPMDDDDGDYEEAEEVNTEEDEEEDGIPTEHLEGLSLNEIERVAELHSRLGDNEDSTFNAIRSDSEENDSEEQEPLPEVILDLNTTQPTQYEALSHYESFASAPETPSGHHFLPNSIQLPPKSVRVVMREWTALQRNLPGKNPNHFTACKQGGVTRN